MLAREKQPHPCAKTLMISIHTYGRSERNSNPSGGSKEPLLAAKINRLTLVPGA